METMLRRLVREDLELDCDLDPRGHAVRVDPDELGQVLSTLVTNACEAMPHGGRVQVRLGVETADEEGPAEWSVLSVSDTGCGIASHIMKHIFEPFFSTKRGGQHPGLGLSTALAIVRRAGGFIQVESALHRGTTVRAYLPRVEEPASEQPELAASEA